MASHMHRASTESWTDMEGDGELSDDGATLAVPQPVVHDSFCSNSTQVLTVRRKPVVFSGGGLTVTDSDGRIVFTVDGRGPSKRQKVLLMDGQGKPLLTVKRRKGLNVYDRWDGYVGQSSEEKMRVFSTKESSIFNEGFEVYLIEGGHKRKPCEYKIKGSYLERSCTIFKVPKVVVAQVKRKSVTSEITLSKDVFNIVIRKGVDHAFIMGLIVILHQIGREDDE